MKRHYYAAQAPRGFGNEINVIRFPGRTTRDRWVEQHADDGDVNSATCGAHAIKAVEAHRIIAWQGDATTESYNRLSDYAGD